MQRVKPVLYVDGNQDSEAAKTALEEAGIDFQAIHIKDSKKEEVIVPQLLSAEGIFPGLNSVQWYADAYPGR